MEHCSKLVFGAESSFIGPAWNSVMCFIDVALWYSFRIAGMFVWLDVKVMVICVSR